MTDTRTEQPWYRRWYRQTIGLAVAMVLAICVSQRDVPVAYPPTYKQVTNLMAEMATPYAVTCSVGVVEIDAGFRWDGASIPRRTWGTLGLHPFSGCIVRGATLHDALYRSRLLPREQADELLLEVCLVDGTQEDKAEVIYQMVRDFGGFAWRGNSDEDVAAARGMVRIRGIPQ